MPGVIEEIDKTIKERNKTDWILLFGVYFVILIIISVIILAGFSSRSDAVLLIGAIFAIILSIYIWYVLIKRKEHLKRERKRMIQSPVMKTPVESYTQLYINNSTKLFADNELLTKTTDFLRKAELVLPERTIELTSDQNAFGRSDFENDLSNEKLGYISSKDGERNHFMITKQDHTFYIQDDFSTNGTKLNDIEIKNRGKKELKNGDKITLAGINNFTITFKISGA